MEVSIAEDVSDTGDKLWSIDGSDVIVDGFMGADIEWPETDGPMSDSPLAEDAVSFADREFKNVAVVDGLPLLADKRGAMLVEFTSVGESNKPNPPSRYLRETKKNW